MAKSEQVSLDMHRHTGQSWEKYVASGQVFGRPDQIRGPDGRYLPRPKPDD